MASISLCMIVKNEEYVLERCLESVRSLADEIIIVDTGSTDRTREIAKKYTDRIYEIPWKDDFAWARNFSFSKAKMDFCMWLDADDVIDEENRKKFKKVKESLSWKTDVVMMKYAAAFNESGEPVFSYYRERLLKNDGSFQWEGRVHEAIVPHGEILYTDVEIFHKKEKDGEAGRNLRIYEKMIGEGRKLVPRELFYYGRELYYNGRKEEAAEVLQEFLQGPGGWLENKIEACKTLSDCYRESGNDEEALAILFRSFAMDAPRAEICCQIGLWFQERERWKEAAFWYKTALQAEKKEENGGFIQEECYGFLPAVNLCLCYDKLGDISTAYKFHKMAAKIRPHAKEVEWNEAYFQKLQEEVEENESSCLSGQGGYRPGREEHAKDHGRTGCDR